MVTQETTGVWLKTSSTLVKYSRTCNYRNPTQTLGGTQKWHKLLGGGRPTEDYQLPAKTQHDDWRPWQSLADCAKKCRSTTDCTGVTLKTTLEKGKCEMVKAGWPGSDDIVTANPEHSTMNREYCESFRLLMILSIPLYSTLWTWGRNFIFLWIWREYQQCRRDYSKWCGR